MRSDCNNCDIDCREEMYSKAHQKCSVFIKPKPLKTPMLRHLMSEDRKAGKCIEVLSAFGLIVKEENKYPWFTLRSKH